MCENDDRLTFAFFSSLVNFKHSWVISNTKYAPFKGFVKAIFPTLPLNAIYFFKWPMSISLKSFWASVWQIPYKSDYKQLSVKYLINGGKNDNFDGKLWKYGPWLRFNCSHSSVNVILHKLSKQIMFFCRRHTMEHLLVLWYNSVSSQTCKSSTRDSRTASCLTRSFFSVLVSMSSFCTSSSDVSRACLCEGNKQTN